MNSPRSLVARSVPLLALVVATAVVAITLLVAGWRPAGGAATALAFGGGTGSTPGISVAGTGTVTVSPDVATLSLGVSAQAAAAAAAQARASGTMANVIAAVKAAGVAERDIATQWISLQPQYDYQSGASGSPRILGYQASQSLSVKVRDLARSGAVIDAAVAAGANQVSGISFSLANPTAATNQAREAAMADARARAQALASAAGVTLGAPISISEVGAPTPTPIPFDRSLAVPSSSGQATPVQAGTTEVEVEVQVTYALGG